MRFITLICLLLGFCQMTFGQAVRLHPRMEWVNVPNKESIILHWKRYVVAAQQGEAVERFWQVGSEDLLPEYISDFYYDFNQELVDIQVDSSGGYCLLIDAERCKNDYNGDLDGVYYRIYARPDGNTWRLINSFDYNKSSYSHYATNHIDFYTAGRPVSEAELMLSERFIEAFEKQFGIHMDNRVTEYYFAGSTQRALDDMVGIITIRNGRTDDYKAQYLAHPKIIVSSTVVQFHELVHAIMIPLYPNAPLLLHEGIATYVGSTKAAYSNYRQYGAYYLTRNKVDLTHYDKLYEILKNDAAAFYAIGAILIEHCYLEGGAEAVLELFKLKDYDAIFEHLGVEESRRTDFIYDLFCII